jgi:hypothetical protein
MMEYWDVNSPNTESSKKSTHAGGERKTTLLERGKLKSSVNALLGELPHKSISTATLLGMPLGRAQTTLYWRCPTIGLTGTWRKNVVLPGT